MNNHTRKNLLYLVVAGFVLLGVNAWAWMGVQSGQLSPIDNRMLWGVFMVLNMVSLLWAVSLLGLQPLVVACAYAAGGFMAYQGVHGLADISIAEVTTAGATYGAIGALTVGNAFTKVRMAFFHKGQIPFIFVIIGLLVVDGVLNSQISGAGWSVVLNALVFPFVFSGVVIGLVWMVVLRVGLPQIKHRHIPDLSGAEEEPASEQVLEKPEADEASQLMIQVPDAVEAEEEPEEIAATLVVSSESVLGEPLSVDEPPVAPSPPADHFFPLEIDKDDEFILPPEELSIPMDLSGSVEETAPEPEAVPEPPEEEALPETTGQKDSGDWLSSHLELMSKIKNS
jgi:hypothetical protein